MYYREYLGYVYTMLKDYDKAISIFKELSKFRIGDFRRASAYYGMAGTYSMQNINKKAFKNLEKAISLGGNYYITKANRDPVFDNIRNEDKFRKFSSSTK